MAVEPASEEVPIRDMEAHVHDYSVFTHLLKWGAIVSFVTALIVMFLISN